MKRIITVLFTTFAGSALQSEGAISFSINPVHAGGSGPSPTLTTSTWTLTFTLPQPATYTNIPPVAINPLTATLSITGSGPAGLDGTYSMVPSNWILAPNQSGNTTNVGFLLTAPFNLSGLNSITNMQFGAYLDTNNLETVGKLS